MGYCRRSCNGIAKRTVRLKFLRSELLYDIKNLAYVESDIMGEENQHAHHITAEIGEEGNVDRVSRMLTVAHTAVTELLFPLTKQEPIEEEIDNILSIPDEYVVELDVPHDMSRTTVHLLAKLIHEYMVYKALADWLSITDAQAAANWESKADAAEVEISILKNKSRHNGAFVRKSSPL